MSIERQAVIFLKGGNTIQPIYSPPTDSRSTFISLVLGSEFTQTIALVNDSNNCGCPKSN